MSAGSVKPLAPSGDKPAMIEIRPSSESRAPIGSPRPSGPARARRRRSALVGACVLALALAASATTGCMVMDELDSAAAKMPTTDKKPAAKAAPGAAAQTPAERLAAAKSAVQERSQQWWKQAKTINTGDAPAGVVSCKLPEGLKFMSEDDCVTQGGKPGDAS